MTFDLTRYSSIVFDCDGVILDSNRVKTEGFRSAAIPYGESAAAALVDHHVANGGVSRYLKFSYFIENIIREHAPKLVPENPKAAMHRLLSDYAQSVRAGLMNCAVAEGLEDLRAATPEARWLIASGGDQIELRDIFRARGISGYFDGGIFGSPESKDRIISREIESGTISKPALFLGDSRLDHQVATKHDLDFVFLSGWTELPEWQEYTSQFDIMSISYLVNILDI